MIFIKTRPRASGFKNKISRAGNPTIKQYLERKIVKIL
jgi:hypothetical protein